MAPSSERDSRDSQKASVNPTDGPPRHRALSSTGNSLYELLGIPKSSDANQIKGTYRKLALQYHPDKNLGNPDASEKFKEISRAYSILSDPNKRRIYDSLGSLGLQASDAFGNSAFVAFLLTNKVFRALFYCIALATCGFCCCCCCFCCYFCCGRFKPTDDPFCDEYPPPDEPSHRLASETGVAMNSSGELNVSYESTSCSRESPEVDVSHGKKLLSDQVSTEYGSIEK
uniref:J domain-containing protein n=1 Tax=Trichuris muris TaxID=70415 RepID=A0A5S6R1X2_TRIMR